MQNAAPFMPEQLLSIIAGIAQMVQVDGIQSLGGTGALRIGMDLLVNKLGYQTIMVSKPTWGMLNCYIHLQSSKQIFF